MAQTAHESGNYTKLHENLNYKAESLVKTFPKYFNMSNANNYAHLPELIANRVYGGRMGNGDEASGEGWKYRGRGIIQITGKDNYRALSKAVYEDESLLETPEVLEEDMDMAVTSACWFWDSRNLNQYADKQDIVTMTKRINGGTIGLQERTTKFNDYLNILRG